MKTIFLKVFFILAFLPCFNSFSQEFLGIKVDGKLNEVLTKFKLKGFKVTSADNYTPILEGKAGTLNVELVIYSSSITKTVYKFNVYLPKKTSWGSLKNEYSDYLKTLTSKYGDPSDTYDFFEYPYKEDDGYEIQAIDLEKCHYSAFWDGISVSISKFKQVKITYENSKNYEIRDAEDAKLKKDIF